jgi:hypothetical protein
MGFVHHYTYTKTDGFRAFVNSFIARVLSGDKGCKADVGLLIVATGYVS